MLIVSETDFAFLSSFSFLPFRAEKFRCDIISCQPKFVFTVKKKQKLSLEMNRASTDRYRTD